MTVGKKKRMFVLDYAINGPMDIFVKSFVFLSQRQTGSENEGL